MKVTPKTTLVTAGGCHPECLAGRGVESSVTGDTPLYKLGEISVCVCFFIHIYDFIMFLKKQGVTCHLSHHPQTVGPKATLNTPASPNWIRYEPAPH